MNTRRQLSQAIFVAKREIAIAPDRNTVPIGEAIPVTARLPEGRKLVGQVRAELRVTRTGEVNGGLFGGRRRVIKNADAVIVGEVFTSGGSPDVVFTSRKGVPVIRDGKILKGERAAKWGGKDLPAKPGPEDLIDAEIGPAARAVRRRSGERI